jgi:hypothetical protein
MTAAATATSSGERASCALVNQAVRDEDAERAIPDWVLPRTLCGMIRPVGDGKDIDRRGWNETA